MPPCRWLRGRFSGWGRRATDRRFLGKVEPHADAAQRCFDLARRQPGRALAQQAHERRVGLGGEQPGQRGSELPVEDISLQSTSIQFSCIRSFESTTRVSPARSSSSVMRIVRKIFCSTGTVACEL